MYPSLPDAGYSCTWSPDLRLAILKRILEGWRSMFVGTDWLWGVDAEESFLYICKIWKSLSGSPDITSDFQDKMYDLVRKHLENYSILLRGPRFLDRWILLPEVPDKIAEALLHARVKATEGIAIARAEIKVLEVLHRAGLEEVSEEGIQKFLQRIAFVGDKTK